MTVGRFAQVLAQTWGVLASLGITSADAHHSGAIFDSGKVVEISGVVREFYWSNPHCWLHLNVREAQENAVWIIEMASPNALAKEGWTSSTLTAGESVTVKVRPLRDQSNGGRLVAVVKGDGRIYENSKF